MSEPATPETHRKRWPLFAAGAVVVLLLLGVAVAILVSRTSDDDLSALRSHDPHGAAACSDLREWLNGKVLDDKGNVESSAIMSLAMSANAAASTTSGINATAGAPALDAGSLALLQANGYGGGNLRFTNLDQLDLACVLAGAHMPPYTDAPAKH